MSTAGVIVSHGHAADVASLAPLLLEQVDELVLVANIPGSVPGALPREVRVLENQAPRCLAANVNAGVAATTGALVVFANPDTRPAPGAVASLAAFAESHPRCGLAGPRLEWPDGRWQPSRRRFPTVGGTLVRRTPLRLLRSLAGRQRTHYLLDEDVVEPVEADWLLGGFVLMRRAMLDELGGWDAGYRHYVEDIDLAYRARGAGWERWYVPEARVVHEWAAVIDRRFLTLHTLWHLRGMARFVRKHPETLLRW
ncbi:MAG: glycosyltransferase family 2 protein [Gaiella sp.]